MSRFFCPDLVGPAAVLPPGEAHHAIHVLRLRKGARVELFDGSGRSAVGEIAEIRRGEVTMAVEQAGPPAERPAPLIHLAFAVPKGKRLDWLLEKATELAAASLQPVVFQRSVAGGEELTPAARDRWLAHCIAAAKQCGLNFLPEIREPVGCAGRRGDLHTLRGGQTALHTLRLLGDLGAEAVPLTEALKGSRPEQGAPAKTALGRGAPEVCILVGPEGGLTPEERAAVINAGFVPVRLGRTTLRIETAAVALLAATVAICGER